jgi:hypothetical protein
MMYALISGAIAMGCWVIGLFFLRFWVTTHDRLFGIFAMSFWGLGLERVFPALEFWDEGQGTQYLVRLSAFLLILLAIIDKNFTNKRLSK